MRWLAFLTAITGSVLLGVSSTTFARPIDSVPQVSEPEVDVDVVGDVDGTSPAPQKALQDTVWIATWTFDTGKPCSAADWTHADNHVRNDGAVWWHIETGFTTPTGMAGQSAAVGYHDDVCCSEPDGYRNDWYQGIRMTYTGSAALSLDYIVDSEEGFDFLHVETDSLCLSYSRVDFDSDPSKSPAQFRTVRVSADGLETNGEWNAVPLEAYGPGTHCVYIAFFSDGGFSPCDGQQPTAVREGAVVDNIVLVDAGGTRSENFEDGDLDIGTFLNMADSKPFGTWARLYPHVSDNDVCNENKTCAWLWTDHTTPTLFNDPSMAFGPGGYVVKNWLDDIIVSPWVSLVSTPTAAGTVLSFRRFPGNSYANSRIVQGWSVRGKGASQGQPCVTVWGHTTSWNALSGFVWQSPRFDMTPYFDPAMEEIQVRFRTSDWQWLYGEDPPQSLLPGPGPYLDDVRIGRRILAGPVISEGIDSRSQAQDCFPTEIHPGVTPAGQHFRPTTDRFGSCAFSEGTDLGINKTTPNLVTGDSVWVSVRGVRPGGTIVTSITWSGAIIAGPHQGKAPPPYTVGANGFFTLNADSVRSSAGSVLANYYFTDLDDFYFRGGDVLVYFWAATDNGGGFTSDPVGLSAPPASIAAAQMATRGLFEVSFLPTITWAAPYLARIGAHANGKLEPTAEEIAASSQQTCILYVQNINSRRMSGDPNRTSFMYALDRLGYRDTYDVYDHQGMGNTNNQLGGRATIQQCQGYSLIVYDNGNGTPGRPLLPNGINLDSEKIDQASWFRNWLAQAASSEAGLATLWILGSNTVEEKETSQLIASTMGVMLVADDQGLAVNPAVDGVASFTFDAGSGATPVDFAPDEFTLNGGCPSIRNYDAIGIGGTAVLTHRYKNPATGALGDGAIVMNRNDVENWNTIMMTFPFFDFRYSPGPPAAPAVAFLNQILAATLPLGCLRAPTPTGTGADDALNVPPRTALHQNVPNPFNPTTRIRFDLARGGKVRLRIYDVAGRLVRTLVDEEMPAGWNHVVVWNGLDDRDREIASGVYFYRLEAPDAELNRKLVVLR